MELESDVIGIHRKFMKYAVHSYKRKIEKKKKNLHNNCPNNNQLVLGLKEF